jgi:hypothetical protein
MLQARQQLPPSPEELLAELISSLEGLDRARCLTISSFVMIVYEYFLTLDDEVSPDFGLVWMSEH